MIPLVAVLSIAIGPHRWTPTNWVLLGTFAAALDVDRATTVWGVRHGYPETNAILGRTPAESQVNAYHAVALVGACAIGALLPSRWRNIWFAALTAMEVNVDRKQLRLGIPFRI